MRSTVKARKPSGEVEEERQVPAKRPAVKHRATIWETETATHFDLDGYVRGSDGQTLAKAILREVGDFAKSVQKALDKRDARIEALENGRLDYAEIHHQGRAYRKGQYCTRGGSLWIATRDFAEGVPGTPKSGWRLAVKKELVK